MTSKKLNEALASLKEKQQAQMYRRMDRDELLRALAAEQRERQHQFLRANELEEARNKFEASLKRANERIADQSVMIREMTASLEDRELGNLDSLHSDVKRLDGIVKEDHTRLAKHGATLEEHHDSILNNEERIQTVAEDLVELKAQFLEETSRIRGEAYALNQKVLGHENKLASHSADLREDAHTEDVGRGSP